MTVYTVRAGDTLWKIARRFGSSVETLARINQLNEPSRLVPGVSLVIPGRSEQRFDLEVNGFAYPNIPSENLSAALPYLSYISPFSYSFTQTGQLIPIYDAPILAAAAAEGAAALMAVTNLSAEGGFSGANAHALLTDRGVQNALLDNILALAAEKGFYGVLFDLEYIFPYDRDAYSSFLSLASERLHARGLSLFAAAAPKTSDEQQGQLYYAHDYGALGACADRVVLMTYEWGYTYSRPQAISPVGSMRRVLDYARYKMSAGKILLGISNYAYDWRLPWRQGQAARVLSNAAAVALAVAAGSPISFDEAAQAPHFNYTDAASVRHEVWFEDARSFSARLALVDEYGLAGISIWNLNFLNRPMLEIINGSGSVEKVI